MFTSAELLKKHLLFTVIGTVFLALFGAVYELFSHGVYSYFMIYAFAVPLLMGVLPYTVMLMKGTAPDRLFFNLWNSSIAALGVGSVFQGVLEIYGTTNALIAVYPAAGGILAALGITRLLYRSRQSRRKPQRGMSGNDTGTRFYDTRRHTGEPEM